MIRALILEDVRSMLSKNPQMHAECALAMVLVHSNSYLNYYNALTPDARTALGQSVETLTKQEAKAAK